MSLQIAILKVLVSHPDGRASVAALKADLAFLNGSGPDWTARLRHLAMRARQLDIFGQGFVRRGKDGWQVTDAGRTFLAALEAGNMPALEEPTPEEEPRAVEIGPPAPQRARTVAGGARRTRPARGHHAARLPLSKSA